MTANKVIAIVMMWIIGQFICLSVNGEVYGMAGADGTRGFLNNFLTVQALRKADGILDYLEIPFEFVQDLIKIVSFDYPFFTGYFIIVRILLMALSAGVVYGLVTTLRR